MELTKRINESQKDTGYEGVAARYNSKDDFSLYLETTNKIVSYDSLCEVRLSSNLGDGSFIAGNYFLPKLTISTLENGDAITKEISHHGFLNITTVDVKINGDLQYRLLDCSDDIEVENLSNDKVGNLKFLMNQYKQEFVNETKRLNVVYHQEKSKQF